MAEGLFNKTAPEYVAIFEAMAKLRFDDADREWAADRLEKILKDFEAIDVETAGVEPLFTCLDIENIMREDVPAPYENPGDLVLAAPGNDGGFFTAPGV